MRIIFYAILSCLAFAIIKFSLESAEINDTAAHRLNLSSSTELVWKSMLEKFSFKLYRGASDEKRTLSALYNEAERRNLVANRAAYGFIGMAVVGLLYRYYACRKNRSVVKKELALDILVIALLSFAVGVLAPIMALKAFTDLPVLGTVVLKYESKSVSSALLTLFQQGNWFIAALISLFSIIVPIMKTGISFLSLQVWRPQWAVHAERIIKAIGKWSMADVFVIAIFIAYFAIGSDNFSDASVGIGLYFFATYCLLSQITTHYLLHAEPVARNTAHE